MDQAQVGPLRVSTTSDSFTRRLVSNLIDA